MAHPNESRSDDVAPASWAAGSFLNRVERHAALATLALLVLLACVAFGGFLFGDKLYIFMGVASDSVNLFYPAVVHVADYLRSEGIPSWSFSHGMGQTIRPFSLGDPFKWILYACGAGNLASAIAHVEALKIIAGGGLFFACLRTARCGRFASAVCAVLFAFSSFMVVGGAWQVFSRQGVYFALYLLAIERILMQRRRWLFPVAIALSAGITGSLFGIAILGSIYGSVRFVEERGWDLRGLFRFFGELAALGVLGLCMSAFVSSSALLDILNSPRGSGEWSLFQQLSGRPVLGFDTPAHNFSAVARLFSSDFLGNGTGYHGWGNYLEAPLFYCGLAPLVLFTQAFLLPGRRKRLIYAALLVIAAIPVVFPFFRYGFWLFSGDYYRVLSLVVVVALLYPTARALDHLVRGGLPSVGAALLTVGVWMSLALGCWKLSGEHVDVDGEVLAGVVALLAAHGALVCALRITAWRSVVLSALLLLVCVEAVWFSTRSIADIPVVRKSDLEEKTGYNDHTVEALSYLRDLDDGFYRVTKKYQSGPSENPSLNDAMIQGFFGTTSYYSFNHVNYVRFLSATGVIESNDEYATRWITGLTYDPLLLIFASNKYLLVKDASEKKRPAGHAPLESFGDVSVFKNLFFLPLGFTYDQALTESEFSTLPGMAKHVALLRAAVLDDAVRRTEFGVLADLDTDGFASFAKDYHARAVADDVARRGKDALEIESFSQNAIRGSVTLEREKLLFFSIPFDAGWSARVDGAAARLHRVNIGFTGLLLPPGRHEVELTYAAPYGRLSAAVSILALCVWLWLAHRDRSTRSQ